MDKKYFTGKNEGPLNLLLLDFQDSFADQVLDQLEREGYSANPTRVDSRASGKVGSIQDIDLVLADCDSGSFTKSSPVGWLSQQGRQIPLLLITDKNTDKALEYIQQGAEDYLLKQNIDQLGHAIEIILLRKSREVEDNPASQDCSVDKQRLNAIAEASLAGLATVDSEEKFSYVNGAFSEMLGYTEDELLRMSLRDVVLSEEYPQIDIQRQKRRKGEVNNYETAFKKKDGTLVYVLVSASPLISPQGEYIGAQAVVIDTSRRVKAEKKLTESEMKVRMMIDNSPLAFSATDMTGTIVSINKAMSDLLGYSEDEMCSRPFSDFTHPEDIQKNAELYTKLVNGDIDHFDLEKRFITKQGTEIDVAVRSQLVRNPDGVPLFEFAIIEDISEIKQAENQNRHLKLILDTLRKINKLMVSEKDLRSLIQSICDLLTDNRGYLNAWIALLDDEGMFVGYAASGLGKAFLPMKTALDKQELPQCAKDSLEGEEIVSVEDPFRECLECPLRGSHNDSAGFAAPLMSGELIHGFLVASIPKQYLKTEEEWDLFQELANDISFIINHIKSEERLLLSKNQQKLQASALESASNAIVITGSDGVIQWANSAFSTLTGFPLEEVLGHNPRFLKSGKQDESFYRELWGNISAGRVWHGEIINKRADGEFYTEEMTITPVLDEKNEIINYVAIKQDITERNKTEQKIIQHTEDLTLINEINTMIREGQDLDRIYEYLSENTRRSYDSKGATVYLLDSKKQTMDMQGLRYPDPIRKLIENVLHGSIPEIRIPVTGESFIGKVVDDKQPLLIHDPEMIRAWMMDFTHSAGLSKRIQELGIDLIPKVINLLKISSMMVVPMISGDECIGVLDISGVNRFTEDDFQRFTSLANQITAAIVNVTANRERIHTQKLLFSLSQSAPDIQRAISQKEIFQIIGNEVKKLDFDVTVFMLNEATDHLKVSYHSFYDLVKKIEKLTGLSAAEYSFPIIPGGYYHKLINGGDPVYSELEAEPIREALPAALQPAAEKIMKMIGNQQAIIVPLILNGKTRGLVSFSGSALLESDKPALKTFVNQAAIALEKNQLFQETKDLAIFSSSIVDNIAEGILIEDAQGHITFANSIAAKLLATSLDGLLGKTWQEILPPGNLKAFEDSEFGKRASGSPYFELELNNSGSLISLLVSRSNYLNEFGNLAGKISVISNVSDLKRAEVESLKQTRRLKALRTIDQAIIGSFDMNLSLNIILEQIIKQLNVDAATVLVYQPDLQELSLILSLGFNTSALAITDLRVGEGFAGKVALSRKPIFIPDLLKDPGEFTRSPEFGMEGFITYYGLPLEAKGKFIGVLEIYKRSSFKPDADWENFLKILGGQVAIAIENFSMYDDLQSSNIDLTLAYDATIEGWAHALELKDMETEGHSRRVVEITMEMSRRMGVSKDLIPHIRRGALLHDIGKMGIPDEILQKKGDLTSDEWEIMKQHPVYAYEWLSRIPYLRQALDIPYAHHERWDGTGYPRQLRGMGIPKAARIFAIVDVWDALISDRPYRKAWPRKKIIAYLEEQSGKHFDPEVVKAFLSLIAEKYPDGKHRTNRLS